jgi:hypothetical protein
VIAAAVAFVFAAAAAHVVSFDEPLAGLWLKHCGGLRQHISAQWRPPHSIMGKTKSKKKTRASPSTQPGQQPQLMMMPQMMPMMMQAPTAPWGKEPAGPSSRNSSSTDSSSSSSVDQKKKADKNLHKGTTFFGKLPKVRLQQICESIHEQFDAPATCNLKNEDMSNLIWLFTRAQPDVKVCFFRAKTYKQLCRKMRKAGERVENSMSEAAHKHLLQELSTLNASEIHKAAMQHGFMEEWLQFGGNKRKVRCGACATKQPIL